MKHFTLVIFCLSLLLFNCNTEKKEMKANKISLVAKLPDTPDYAIDGVFVDIGIKYNIVDIFGFSIYAYNKEWCLYYKKKYWVLEKEQLDVIAQSAGIILPSEMKLPFWDEWSGRVIVIFCLIVTIIIYDVKPKKKK